MKPFEQKIAKLETERETISARCREIASAKSELQEEYDMLTGRRLEAQKEINEILRAEIKAQGGEV